MECETEFDRRGPPEPFGTGPEGTGRNGIAAARDALITQGNDAAHLQAPGLTLDRSPATPRPDHDHDTP